MGQLPRRSAHTPIRPHADTLPNRPLLLMIACGIPKQAGPIAAVR
jgi:hypothetical protein